MKHKLLMVLQFTIAFVLVGGMLASESAGDEFPMKYHLSGKVASADFIDDSTGQLISGFVQVSKVMYKLVPGSPERPGPMGFLTIRKESIDNADGYQMGTAIIELTSLKISNNLFSAYAEGKGTLIWEQPSYSSSQQPQAEEITIFINWTSEEKISSGHNNVRSSYDDIITYVHSSGIFRYATATGLIIGETFEVEVKPPPPPQPSLYPPPYPYPAPYPYSSATIGRSQYGFISIYKR